MIKSLKDISWNVSEEEYREDKALSYSTLAKYERQGFNSLSKLFDKISTPSLTFGSAVDSIITGGMDEFNTRFIVCDLPDTPDNIISICKNIYEKYGIITFDEVDNAIILDEASDYQKNWKPETRIKVIREKGTDYYNTLALADNKEILTTDIYNQVVAAVRALKESKATEYYFRDDIPFENVERLYQLKFKASFNGVEYRNMADLIVVDYDKKTIQPIDLKTSSHYEYEFYKSFDDWLYVIQSRLYWRIIKANIEKDDFFKDFELLDYKFIVVNKFTLNPLVWSFRDTKEYGTLKYNNIEYRDPFEIGEELSYYLNTTPIVPKEIKDDNDIVEWLIKYKK